MSTPLFVTAVTPRRDGAVAVGVLELAEGEQPRLVWETVATRPAAGLVAGLIAEADAARVRFGREGV